MSLRASTMSGARSSIMLAARNDGLAMSLAFASASWTSRSVMIHISVQTTDGYHFRSTPISRQFQSPRHLAKCRKSDVVAQRYTAALASPPGIGSGACELWTLGIGAVCEREKLAVIDSGLVTIARGL